MTFPELYRITVISFNTLRITKKCGRQRWVLWVVRRKNLSSWALETMHCRPECTPGCECLKLTSHKSLNTDIIFVYRKAWFKNASLSLIVYCPALKSSKKAFYWIDLISNIVSSFILRIFYQSFITKTIECCCIILY